MSRTPSRVGRLERGQALVMVAVAFSALLGIAALAVDLGLIFAQRRFDQNGADAAALAAARMLAAAASPLDTSGALYLSVSDADVYREVRRYAGLDPNTSAATPTGINRGTGLASQTTLAVTLEYAAAGVWCYSPSGPAPLRSPPVPPCALAVVSGVAYPPLPVAAQAYRVRVTVSSTAKGLFAPAAGIADRTPAAPQDQARPACLRTGGTGGNTTCAHAVTAIAGATGAQSPAPIIPVATADCQIAAPTGGVLFELWGSTPSGCGVDLGSWKNMLDFTTETRWCNTLKGNSDPDYRYTNLLPPGAQIAGGPCEHELPDPTWSRAGYTPDPAHPGQNDVNGDMRYWIAAGFGGTLRAGYTDGNRFPTYVELQSSPAGDLGQNVAAGFYCGSSGVTATSCSVSINPAGTYFFAKNRPDFHDVCPDQWGTRYGAGCREAAVVTWAQPEWVVDLQSGGTGWSSSGSGGPARVRAARLLTFRLYCDHDNNGLCTLPPKSIVGSAAGSTVWGRAVSPLITGACATCTAGPSLVGNKVSLE